MVPPEPLTKCLICLEPMPRAQEGLNVGGVPVATCSCPICGPYRVERLQPQPWQHLSPRQRGLLSGVLRRRIDLEPSGPPLDVTGADVEEFARAHGAAMATDEGITRLLEAIVRDAPMFGQVTPLVDQRAWAARAYIWGRDAGVRLIAALEELGYLHRANEGGESVGLTLTIAGWEEYERRRARTPDSRHAFIASWSDPAVLGAPVAAIGRALRAAGLDPVVGATLAERDRVTDSIEAAIRRSRLVVADYTGGRAGVYFEAGLARGLGIPVIHCCQSSWTTLIAHPSAANAVSEATPTELVLRTWRDMLHFDTQQFPHIFWENTADLERRVLDRVQAWGLALRLPGNST